MNGKEFIKELMKTRDWSQSRLAEETGLKKTNINGYLNRGNTDMRVDTFVSLCSAMGYEVVIRDKMDNDKVVGVVKVADN